MVSESNRRANMIIMVMDVAAVLSAGGLSRQLTTEPCSRPPDLTSCTALPTTDWVLSFAPSLGEISFELHLQGLCVMYIFPRTQVSKECDFTTAALTFKE